MTLSEFLWYFNTMGRVLNCRFCPKSAAAFAFMVFLSLTADRASADFSTTVSSTTIDYDEDVLPDVASPEKEDLAGKAGPHWSLYKEHCTFDSSNIAQLPKFADGFELRAEVKWSTTNAFDSSFEITGYYDRGRHRGATVIVREDIESRFLYDFQSAKAFVIDSRYPYYCSSSQNLYDMACSPYALYIMEEAGYETIRDKCQMHATEISKIDSTGIFIRDFPVNIYRQCVWMNTTASDSPNGSYWLIEYLFSDDATVTGRTAPAPLRLNVTRLDMAGPFSALKPRQLYDFFSYRPHIQDDTVFEPPAGVHCRGWPAVPPDVVPPTVPPMPEQFSVTTMTTSSHRPLDILHTKFSIDNRINAAVVLTDEARWTHPAISNYRNNRHRSRSSALRRTVVYDFNTRFWFASALGTTSDTQQPQCLAVRRRPLAMNTDSIEGNTAHKAKATVVPYMDELISVSIEQASILFNAKRLRYTYMGMRTLGGKYIRQQGTNRPQAASSGGSGGGLHSRTGTGPLLHMWIATRKFEDMAPGEHVTVELYFYDGDVQKHREIDDNSGTVTSDESHQYIPAGIAVYRFAESHRALHERTLSVVTSFSDEPLPWQTFNISQCLHNQTFIRDAPHNIVLSLKLAQPDANTTELLQNALNGEDKGKNLRIAIAQKMNVSALRVTGMSLLVDPMLVDHIKFTLHGWPTNDNESTSTSGSEFFYRMRHVEPSVRDAVARLNASLSAGDMQVSVAKTAVGIHEVSDESDDYDKYDEDRRSNNSAKQGGDGTMPSRHDVNQDIVFIVRNSLRTIDHEPVQRTAVGNKSDSGVTENYRNVTSR